MLQRIISSRWQFIRLLQYVAQFDQNFDTEARSSKRFRRSPSAVNAGLGGWMFIDAAGLNLRMAYWSEDSIDNVASYCSASAKDCCVA